MAEAMCEEVAAESAKPAEDVQVDSAGAHTEQAVSGKKRAAVSAAGHEQQRATIITEEGEAVAATMPEKKAPKPDEVRRSAERASESEGQTGNAAKMDQGTSLHGGKADLKAEMGAAGTRRAEDTEGAADSGRQAPEAAAVKETVVQDSQAVCAKAVSSTAHTVTSANETKDEPLSYEPFWRANEREVISSKKPEIRRPRANDSRPEPTRTPSSKKNEVQNDPTKIRQAAQEIVDSIVAEYQVFKKSPDLGTTTKTKSILSIKTRSRGELPVEKEEVPANVMNEHSGTLESTGENEQQSSKLESTAIDGTTEIYMASPISLSSLETNNVEAETMSKRATQAITASKLVLTSATSLSGGTQAGTFENTSGPLPKESTDGKSDAEKKSSTDHRGTAKIPEQVVETDGPPSSGSIETISISIRPGTGGKELEPMTETSEATLKIISLGSLSDKKSTNKAKKVAPAKHTSNILQPEGGTEVLELSAGVPVDTIGAPPEGSEVGQASKASVDLKMEKASMDSKTEKASMDSKTEKASVDSKTEKASVDSKTEKASVDSKTEKASVDSKTEKASVDSKTEKASVDSKTEKASVDSKMEKASVDSKTEKASVDSKTEKASVDSKTEKASADSKTEKASVDSKMESTGTENEATKTKILFSKKSKGSLKKQKSSMQSTKINNVAQKPTEEDPSHEMARRDDSCDEQLATKTPGGTDAKDQTTRKLSVRKPTKTTKKDLVHKQETISEAPDVNTGAVSEQETVSEPLTVEIGATAHPEVTVSDVHTPKTATETNVTVSKGGDNRERPTLPKTVSDQKSTSKDTKKQPRRKKDATEPRDTNTPIVPNVENVIEPSAVGTTDRDESGVLTPSESTEVSSKGAPVSGVNAKAQLHKTGPQMPNSKKPKKNVPKTESFGKLASGPQRPEDIVAPITSSSTTKSPTYTESVSSVTTKKDATKTELDNVKNNQKRNVKAAKTQHGKGKSFATTTTSGSKTPQPAERISDENATVTVREGVSEVKTVVESENINTKIAKTYPGRKLNNKTTKAAAKKSAVPSAGDSQKDTHHSSQEATLRTECVSGTSAANDEHVSSPKTFSDQKKSNTMLEKDQMKPVDSASEAEKKTVKATELDKDGTLPSGGVIQNENSGVQTVELVKQSSKGDPHACNEEPRKANRLTQKKPERINPSVKENKRKTIAKSNEKQSAVTAQKETTGDNSDIKSTEMQESGAKPESTNCTTQTSDSRPSDRNSNRNMVTPPVNRMESEKKDAVPDRPVAPTETSPESIIKDETSTVDAAVDTTSVAEKVVSEVLSRKPPASQKKARKEKASLKKAEEACRHSETEPPIKSNETSIINTDRTTDSIQTEKTNIELGSTALAAKSVGAKTHVPKSPSELKPKRKVANAQLKKSSSLVAIPKSKSKTTVLIDGAKVSLSGDTELTKGKTVSLMKSESLRAISVDSIKRPSTESQDVVSPKRQRICSLKQQKTCREQERVQSSASKGKDTKENDLGLSIQHPSNKPILSRTKEGKTESDISDVFEASESVLKDAKKREENKELVNINSDEADASGKSGRKAKAGQKPKESRQNNETDNVDRPVNIQSKGPQEKSLESAEIARLSPSEKPASPRARRQKLTPTPEETEVTPETKLTDAEDASEPVKDITDEKSRTAKKGENVPGSRLPKHGNLPCKKTEEEVAAEAKQRTVCVKQETRATDKLNDMPRTQKKPGQVKYESVPTTVTVTLKAGDHKGKGNKSAGDTAKTGETVECTISTSVKPEEKVVNRSSEVGRKPAEEVANRSSEVGRTTSVAKKKEQRSSKPREQTEEASTVGEKIAATGPSTVSGDGAKEGSHRKQTADHKDLKSKAKNTDAICVVIEEIPHEQKSKALGKAEADPHEKQHAGNTQDQLTSDKDAGLPQSSPRKSPRRVSKTAPASSPRAEMPSKINSLDKEETKGAARIAIVEIEEIKDTLVICREKRRSSPPGDVSNNTKYHHSEDSKKAVEKASARESKASPRSKQAALKKGVIQSVQASEHSEDDTAAVVTQRTSKTDADTAKRNESNASESARSTSPQRLLAQLRTFMTQASLLHKLDLKSKILECMGVNQVQDGYKIPASRGKIKASTAVVTDLQKVAAALKVGRKRLEDQTTSKVGKGKVVPIRVEESSTTTKKELLADIGLKSSTGVAEEVRNKLINKTGSFRGRKHRDRKSTTGSSCLSSSSDTPRPILVKDRARKRKARNERKGVPRVRFSDTTSGLTTVSSRPSHSHGSKHQRWASATPEIPARVKLVSPRRHGSGTGPKFPVGIVSSTMLALKRMRPSSVEKSRPLSPSPSRGTSKPLPAAAAAIMAVTMKAREIAKVPRHETKAAAERRSRSPRTASKKKQPTTRETDKKRNRKPEQRTGEIVIRGLTAAAAGFPAVDRMEESISDFAPVQHIRKLRETAADDYDRTPVIAQTYSEADNPVSPRKGVGRPAEKVIPTWHSTSYTPSPPRKPSRSPTSEKSPTLHVLHDNKRPLRTKTTVINSSPTEVPCSVAITKKTSVPAQSSKRSTRKGAPTGRASIEHVVNIDIRMGSLANDATTLEDARGRSETPVSKNSVITKDTSVGTEEMQVLDVCIRALPIAGNEGELDETSVRTLMRAKEKSETGGGDVDDAARDSSESMLALTDMQAGGAGDRTTGYSADGEGDEDSGAESDASSKTWPRATLVTPTTKTLAANFPRFSTSSVPEEAARATAALERSLKLVARACQSRPLECDLRWSAWMSALHAGDPDAAATPFPSSLSRSGRRDVDAALAAAVRVPALWLLAGLRAAELGARTVKLLHWLLVRLPAEGPALRSLDPKEIACPCKPSAAFKVRVCAGSSLDARLRWRARGLPAFEAWASPAPCQLHALVCGGATTPVGVLSLTLSGALRRAQPGYGCGASRLGSRLRCVLKCDVAHHPELVERIGADAVVVRGLDLVRVRQLLIFSEPLPEGALAVWAARALKKRRLVVAVAAIVLTYLLLAAVVWLADPAIVTFGDGPDVLMRRFLPWSDEPEAPAAENPNFSFWA